MLAYLNRCQVFGKLSVSYQSVSLNFAHNSIYLWKWRWDGSRTREREREKKCLLFFPFISMQTKKMWLTWTFSNNFAFIYTSVVALILEWSCVPTKERENEGKCLFSAWFFLSSASFASLGVWNFISLFGAGSFVWLLVGVTVKLDSYLNFSVSLRRCAFKHPHRFSYDFSRSTLCFVNRIQI